MCHYPIHIINEAHALFNSQELQDIINGYSNNVVMWINGHNHAGDYVKLGERHHLGLKGMQNDADATRRETTVEIEMTERNAESDPRKQRCPLPCQ